jgi:hypothetical protein
MNRATTLFNFLPFCQNIYDLAKQLKFYNRKDFEQTDNASGDWPGLRTDELRTSAPFLYLHIATLLEQSRLINLNDYENICMYCHLRLLEDKDNDWAHYDASDTAIIYLSKTNFSSGTDFYDAEDKIIASTKFIQGTCVFFEQGLKHASVGNHGTSIDDGRMTINVFMMKKK